MRTKTISQAEHLQSAFADFEQASSELKSFYASLETRVAELTSALRKAEAAESSQRAENAKLAIRLSSLLDALPAGVVELASDGKVRHLNPAARELLGSVECGEQWSEVVERTFAPRWDDGHDISLGNQKRVNIDTAALPDKAGQILLIKDVSETRRLQARLNHHQRLSAKTEVAAALAHQVRTPLSAAILHLSQLRLHHNDNEKAGAALEKALKGLTHIERLVSDMLMYSRDQKFEMTQVSVCDFLTYLGSHARAPLSIHIQEIEPVNAESSIRVNQDALVSVVQNLIDNASNAGASEVAIYCRVENKLLKLCIRDNGPGIATDVRQEIFEPFVSGKGNGTGLGLAIGRAVCRAHGGDLIVLDAPQKNGACFALILPLLETDFEEITELKQAF